MAARVLRSSSRPVEAPSRLAFSRLGDAARWTVQHHSIDSYGVIGNNRTAVLVAPDGSIDWAPFPKFDSSPVFMALLDARHGGFFALGPADRTKGRTAVYEPGTNVLEHRFRTRRGAEVQLIDFCPEVDSDQILMSEIHRRISVLKGRAAIEVRFAPRFAYAREVPSFRITDHGALAVASSDSAALSTHRQLRVDPVGPGAIGRFTLEAGQEEWFVCSVGSEVVTPLEAFQSPRRLEQTLSYWRRWSHRSTYHGRWRSAVERSSLLLKLLFYRPTGAMVAAPTTSLPEIVGGVRNWDYRFAWVRDTALAVRALFRLGYTEEAEQFIYWLLSILDRDQTGIRIFYTVDGSPPPPERDLSWLAGFRNSRPVRVGNAAHEQTQHDILGNVVSIAELLDLYGGIVSVDLWKQIRHLVERAAEIWAQSDNGIWEVRGPRQHYVYSKAMCWMALVRGAALGERLGFIGPFAEWRAEADRIRNDVLERGRSPDGRSLVWYYGATGPDASLLRLPELGFLPPEHPMMLATVERIEADLGRGPFVYRYRLPDGLPPGEAFFLPCAFWRIEYYTLAGNLSKARMLLEELLEHAGPLGLFAEQIDAHGQQLGNYPQAFSHLALLSAATQLNEALDAAAGTTPAVTNSRATDRRTEL